MMTEICWIAHNPTRGLYANATNFRGPIIPVVIYVKIEWVGIFSNECTHKINPALEEYLVQSTQECQGAGFARTNRLQLGVARASPWNSFSKSYNWLCMKFGNYTFHVYSVLEARI